MTLPGTRDGRLFWRPSYVRRAPRWHDGAGRLMDLGNTFDLRLGEAVDADSIAEDWAIVRDDLRRSAAELQALASSFSTDG